jgi:hypothetical protein
MEHDIHPERPRPVEPKPPRQRPGWLDPVLCVAAPALVGNIVFASLLDLPLSQTLWFAVISAALSLRSVQLNSGRSESGPSDWDNRLPILIALIVAISSFTLAWKFAQVFASLGIASLAFALGGLRWGAAKARAHAGAFAILLFAFPWTDPSAGFLGFPWRESLAQIGVIASGPLVGSASAQGTTLSVDSVRLGLTSDVGGFWQAQLFLLCAAGFPVGSKWSLLRRVAWFAGAALLAAAAYFGFVVSCFVATVVAAGVLPQARGNAIEIAWWVGAFGILWWMAREPRKTSVETKRSVVRQEPMFSEDARRS